MKLDSLILTTSRINAILLFGIITFASCASFYPSKSEVSANRRNNVDNHELMFDGVYDNIHTFHHPTKYENGAPVEFDDTPYVEHPLILFKNGEAFYSLTGFSEKSDFSQYVKPSKGYNIYDDRGWGTFTLTGDTIKAIVYQDFKSSGFPRTVFRACIFQGIVEKEGIRGWHMIKPYPKLSEGDERNQTAILTYTSPVNLKFRSIPEVQQIDSKLAWINNLKK